MFRPLTAVYRLRVLSTRSALASVAPLRQFASAPVLGAKPRLSTATSSYNPSNPPPLLSQHRQNGQPFTDSYHLSDRITLLSRRSPSQLLSAVQLVKASPTHIATVVPWNVLLHECFHHGKFKLAYEVWMDMKRRGVRPTARSFGTFFKGCGGMRGGPGGVEGLARVRTVWGQWLVHAEKVLEREEERRAAGGGGRRRKGAAVADELEVEGVAQAGEAVDTAEDITNLPSNNFLQSLTKTDQIDLLLETFHSMPNTGPLSPDIVTYSIVLSALRPLVASPSATPADAATHFAAALKVWERLTATPHLSPDAETVSLLISICRASPAPQDQVTGLKLAEEWFGLLPPSEAHKLATPGLAEPKVAMDSPALSNVLTLVTTMQKYNLVVEWFDQVRDHPERYGDVVEHWQCDLVLVALGYKKDAQGAEDLVEWMQRSKSLELQPTRATWTNALQVCWRAADLARACRLLGRMTGKPIPSATSSAEAAEEDAELPAATSPKSDTFAPDSRTISTLLQTALATRDRGNIARTLQIIDNLGFGAQAYSLAPQHDAADPSDQAERRPRRKREDPHAFFWQFKLAEVVERSLERVLQGGEGHLTAERRKELAGWRRAVIEWLEVKEEAGKETRRGSSDGQESMRKRRERLGIPVGKSALAPRKWRGEKKGEQEEGEGGEKRLNRRQRRMLARGDSIEPTEAAAAEAGDGGDGFVVSSRAKERADDGREGRRFEARPPRSWDRRDEGRAPRRFERDDYNDRPPRRSSREDSFDRPPRRFPSRDRDDYSDRPPRHFSDARDRGDFDDRSPRRFSRQGDSFERPPRRFAQDRDAPPHRPYAARPDRRREDRGEGSMQRGWDD